MVRFNFSIVVTSSFSIYKKTVVIIIIPTMFMIIILSRFASEVMGFGASVQDIIHVKV